MNFPKGYPKDVILVIVLIGIAIIFWFWFRTMGTNGAIAQISINGEDILTVDLNQEENQQIDLSEYGVDIQLEVKDHAIRFTHSDCPDQICLGYGFIDTEPQTAVCMPNRTAIVIHSEKLG